jgi:hypothetical protein
MKRLHQAIKKLLVIRRATGSRARAFSLGMDLVTAVKVLQRRASQ